MNSHTGRNGEFQGMGWVGDSAVVLLLIGTGLAVFVQQTLGHVSLATTLLALYAVFLGVCLGLPRPLLPLSAVARELAARAGHTGGLEPIFPCSSISSAAGRDSFCSEPIARGER